MVTVNLSMFTSIPNKRHTWYTASMGAIDTYHPCGRKFLTPLIQCLIQGVSFHQRHPHEELRDVEGREHQLVHVSLRKTMHASDSSLDRHLTHTLGATQR